MGRIEIRDAYAMIGLKTDSKEFAAVSRRYGLVGRLGLIEEARRQTVTIAGHYPSIFYDSTNQPVWLIVQSQPEDCGAGTVHYVGLYLRNARCGCKGYTGRLPKGITANDSIEQARKKLRPDFRYRERFDDVGTGFMTKQTMPPWEDALTLRFESGTLMRVVLGSKREEDAE